MGFKLPFRALGSVGAKRYIARAFLGVITTLGVLGHVTGYYTVPYINQIENLLYDTRVRLSAKGGVDERIVVIAVDEPSLQEHGHWPWTRDKLALLVENAFAYNVAVIGFDMVFPERDVSSDMDILRSLGAQTGDQQFLQRLDEFEPLLDRDVLFSNAMAAGPVIMGYYFDTNEESAYVTGELPFSAFDLHESMIDSVFLPRAAGYSSNLPVLM